MDYQQILTIAENRLKEEFSYIIKDLKELISSCSTGVYIPAHRDHPFLPC
jgi:hypothetical protein